MSRRMPPRVVPRSLNQNAVPGHPDWCYGLAFRNLVGQLFLEVYPLHPPDPEIPAEYGGHPGAIVFVGATLAECEQAASDYIDAWERR